MRKLKNVYALITGASSGIGEAFAEQLSKEGYPVILVARRKERLQQTADKIEKQGGKAIVITADLAKKEECFGIIQQLEDKKIGVFINNAGFGDCGMFLSGDLEKETNMIDVNIKAMHILCKLVLQKMHKQDGGYILNVASSAGLIPAGPYMATYYATKAYVVSLTRAIAQELQDEASNIYIGALCPGPVNTEFNSVANVEFALRGISPSYCVKYAIRQMKKRKVLIVPTPTIKAATFFGRFIPQSLYIKIAGHQQKKKFKG